MKHPPLTPLSYKKYRDHFIKGNFPRGILTSVHSNVAKMERTETVIPISTSKMRPLKGQNSSPRHIYLPVNFREVVKLSLTGEGHKYPH